ncbi:phage holin family protein [Microbacterium terrisoli]|uniref:phage holin family protein n=1 Tax=Microbacterium terrisoli TaxID=3242192 RepID=UPI0028063E93|nr:phage holin family protein [Microbacterium protaetiae]
MPTSRRYRDRSADGFLTLIGDLPELVRNLVVAEIDAAKTWVRRTAKDAGIGAGWMAVALFFLFWSVPVLLGFFVAGLSSWWPVWLSALVVFGIGLLLAVVFALLGLLRFRRLTQRQNPGQAVAKDVKIVKDVTDEF